MIFQSGIERVFFALWAHARCVGMCGLLVLCSTLVYMSSAFAGEVTLRWDANNEQDLVGYKVYKRMLPSLDYGYPVFS